MEALYAGCRRVWQRPGNGAEKTVIVGHDMWWPTQISKYLYDLMYIWWNYIGGGFDVKIDRGELWWIHVRLTYELAAIGANEANARMISFIA